MKLADFESINQEQNLKLNELTNVSDKFLQLEE